MWTNSTIKALKPKKARYRKSENTGQRGVGRLVIDVQPNGLKTFYFQYFREGERVLISIGRYKQTAAIPGLSLGEARTKGNKFSAMIQNGIDVEFHLEDKKIADRQRKREREAAKYQGTFDQLLDSYVESLDGRASYSRLKHSIGLYVKKAFPELLNKYANEITPSHIGLILKRMMQKGITTQSNRVRSQLHAAFEYGTKQDNDPRRYDKEKVLFNLSTNPVRSVPNQPDFEREGEHVISDEDVRTIWNQLSGHHFITGHAVNLGLATGQRIGELIRLKVENFHLEDRIIVIPTLTTKSKKSDHIVPLNGLGEGIVTSLLEVTGQCEYAFPCIKQGTYGDSCHIVNSTIDKHVRDFCKQTSIEKFIPRDIRRTVKTLAGKAGISKEIRDRIQGHALSDVSSKHYDKYDYLPEKREGLKVWNDYLSLILDPQKNVTRLKRKSS